MLSTVAEIIRDLLIFVGVIAALLIALIVVVSKLPDTNPLKRLLTALCYRLGATLAAGAIAIPSEPIPGNDLAYDIGVPIALIWYWSTFFRDARRTMAHTPSQGAVYFECRGPRCFGPCLSEADSGSRRNKSALRHIHYGQAFAAEHYREKGGEHAFKARGWSRNSPFRSAGRSGCAVTLDATCPKWRRAARV
jgi:hypothetical protein